MKTFEIITESDARVLERGETVTLARGGHITPLAQDTLNERRVKVLRADQVSDDDAALAPRAEIRAVAIGSDHTGIELRRTLVTFLRGRGLAVNDLGTYTTEPVDYPDVAAGVAETRGRGGTAITETIARYSREHNGANVLALGATLVTEDEARAIVTTWLTTSMREPRYIRRLSKIRDIERRQK